MTPVDLAKWSNVNLSEALAKQVQEDNKATAAKDPGAKLLRVPEVVGVPPVKIEQSPENATSGKGCLKLTYAGGKPPTVGDGSTNCRDTCFRVSLRRFFPHTNSPC
ncbi:MAG: hypothetical protein H8E44_48430 [Planctomycetes bacterium]|nr:hypothetical protein [Planctomycetota bacterium]MBL7037065.1 hypothetical protein [Pirellulaceae bacterium]